MNMELQKFIKETLGLNNVEPEIAIDILSDKLQEIENAKIQLESIQKELQIKIDEKFFSKCYNELKEGNFNVVRNIDHYEEYQPLSVGVNLENKLTIWIGKDENNGLFCQLNTTNNYKTIPIKTQTLFRKILFKEEVQKDKKGYQIWGCLENEDKALIYLKELCNQLSEN
jgi:hypothetical protein